MRRATLFKLMAVAAAFAALTGAPAIVGAADAPYDHEWRIEGLYGGEVGSTRRTILEDEARLGYRAGRWSGTISYRDLLGIQDAGGSAQSQESSVTLALTGQSGQGGVALSGRFTGVAELRGAPAGSLDEAMRTNGATLLTIYDVSGFWAADLEGNIANGYLVYQSATPRPGASGPQYDAEWFNRAPDAAVDATGEPQAFSVAIGGAAPVDSEKPAGAAKGFSGAPSLSGATADLGFFDYVLRGLRGVKLSLPAPVSNAQSEAARRLRDAKPSGAEPLPVTALTIDLDMAGSYLDAKNRATGLLGYEGPSGSLGREGVEAAATLATEATVREAYGDPSRAANGYKAQLMKLLEGQQASGAEELLGDVRIVPSRADSETAAALLSWLSAVEAVSMPPENGDGLVTAARRGAAAIERAPIPQEGRLADAILASGDSPSAPADAVDVARFDRVEEADIAAPVATFAANTDRAENPAFSPVLAVVDPSGVILWSGGTRRENPEAWLAYRRSDDAEFWLAGDMGDIALTDASVRGWMWQTPHVAVVDAARVGRVLELLGSQR